MFTDRNNPRAGALATLFLLAGALPAAGQEAATVADAIAGGKPAIALRYRLEHVDQDGFDDNALASTLRLRLNYGTAAYRDWTAFIEFDYVAEVLADDFNSGGGTSPGRTQYPVVADPDGPDLNQLYVEYGGFDDTSLRVGRQRILLDNQRFVGGVGWRQNEQTFDGVTIRHAGIGETDIHYSYVTRVNRIFGDGSAAGRDDGDIHLLNLRLPLKAGWTLTPYGYYIDSDDTPAFSTATAGIRATGGVDIGEMRVDLAVELATQGEAGNAPVDYRAEYLRLDASLALNDALSVGVGYESLGGDADELGKAFRTPLATLHAFQGWADQFLATPGAGVEDLSLSASWVQGPWRLEGTWHRFTAEAGDADWGSELDVSLQRKLGERYGLLFKAARFDADADSFADVTKFWLMLTAAY